MNSFDAALDTIERERLAARIYNAAFSNDEVLAALNAPWPDASDLEGLDDMDLGDEVPLNPRGAPDMSFTEVTAAMRVIAWGDGTATHILALERAVRLANQLRWPYMGR